MAGELRNSSRQAGEIHVIPTTYEGIKFRSRLEARWAVFFDSMGIEWDYEPEAFGNGFMGYTPDFWLPGKNSWWEVKADAKYPTRPLELALRATGKAVYVAFGSIGSPFDCACGRIGRSRDAIHHWVRGDFGRGPESRLLYRSVEWTECSHVDDEPSFVSLESARWTDTEEQITKLIEPEGEWSCICDEASGPYSSFVHTPRLHTAYRAAQIYRFWEPS